MVQEATRHGCLTEKPLNRANPFFYAADMTLFPTKKGVFLALVSAVVLVSTTDVRGQGAGAQSFAVSELSFARPDAWQSVRPSSSMRKAQLKVPGSEGVESAEVVFFYFGPGNAGGTKANIDRWFRQFQEPVAQLNTKTERVETSGIPVTFVHAEGTFLSGPPVGRKVPKADYALLGAIVEAQKGFIFVKMTGPKAVVQGAEGDFKTMISSAKR